MFAHYRGFSLNWTFFQFSEPHHIISPNGFSKQVINPADFSTLKIWDQSDRWFLIWPLPLILRGGGGSLKIWHRKARLNLAGTCGQANLARTSLHNMGPSKNYSHTFNKHFATEFCRPMWPVLGPTSLKSSKFCPLNSNVDHCVNQGFFNHISGVLKCPKTPVHWVFDEKLSFFGDKLSFIGNKLSFSEIYWVFREKWKIWSFEW